MKKKEWKKETMSECKDIRKIHNWKIVATWMQALGDRFSTANSLAYCTYCSKKSIYVQTVDHFCGVPPIDSKYRLSLSDVEYEKLLTTRFLPLELERSLLEKDKRIEG